MADISTGLNDKQREAVLHTEGPLLILAGAGSGKTRVLVHRIAHILQEGKARGGEILALTFTNKAAGEMKKRVEELVGDTRGMWVGTFHATGARILRKHAPRLGVESSFTIIDKTEQQTLVRDCLKELNIDVKKFPPAPILRAISSAKNELKGPGDFVPGGYFEEKVLEVYKLYEEKKRVFYCLDFDDLILLVVRLLKECPGVLEEYRERFKYILVDEYQDTNLSQYMLVSLLASRHQNICVVGDDDQSIYQFRGADIRNILEFEKDFPEAVIIKLEENYRSCGNILQAANCVVQNNASRKPKELWTRRPPGDRLLYCQSADEWEEARYIAGEIRGWRRDGLQSAVLYRINAQSRVLEEVFMREGIPYTLVGALRFYDRKEIKDITAYLKLLANPRDDISLKRIINMPRRGIGDKTISKIEDLASGEPLIVSLKREHFWSSLSPTAGNRLSAFVKLITNLREMRAYLPVKEMMDKVLTETGYLEALQQAGGQDAENRMENLQEYMQVAAEFDSLYDGPDEDRLQYFLERVALISDVDNLSDEGPPVLLMTLHSAKGLEFPVVFLAGMEERLFPHARALEEGNLEEERRLCYVGITRARERLYLTRAKRRRVFSEAMSTQPSRFLAEIPPELIEDVGDPGGGRLFGAFDGGHSHRNSGGYGNNTPAHTDNSYDASKAAPPPRGTPDAGGPACQGGFGLGAAPGSREAFRVIAGQKTGEKQQQDWRVGQAIHHSKWGLGHIKEIKDLDGDQVLTVLFPREGVKKIMARYAPIRHTEG